MLLLSARLVFDDCEKCSDESIIQRFETILARYGSSFLPSRLCLRAQNSAKVISHVPPRHPRDSLTRIGSGRFWDHPSRQGANLWTPLAQGDSRDRADGIGCV